MNLLNKKALLKSDNNNEIEISNNPKFKPYNIVQYNNKINTSPGISENISNIYAPIVNKREFSENNLERLGYKKGLEKAIDKKIEKNLQYYRKIEEEKNKIKREKKIDQYKLLNAYCPGIEGIYLDRRTQNTKSNLYNIDCRGQTKKLYKFNNNNDKSDCFHCEQLFNNQTKRKTINVNRIPQHLL